MNDRTSDRPDGTSAGNSAEPHEHRAESVEKSRSPWGFWATTAFGLLVAGLYFIVQMGVVFFLAGMRASSLSPGELEQASRDIAETGLAWSLALSFSVPPALAAIVLIVILRQGPSIKHYLALRPVALRPFVHWGIVMVVLVAVIDAFTYLVGRPVVPDFMFKVYATAGSLPLLWFALVVAAPIFEEAFFRGFLFEGYSRSALGPAGAVVLTTALWTVVHIQYDHFQLATIFLYGLFLGYARVKTRSLYPPIVMHSLANVIATSQVAIFVYLRNGG